MVIDYIDDEPHVRGILDRIIGKHNMGTTKFGFAGGLGTDGQYVYVCDLHANMVEMFDENADFIKLCGSNFRDGPSHIAMSESQIYVAYMWRIRIFNIVNQKFIREINVGRYCCGLSVYKSRIYVCYVSINYIDVYTTNGKLITNVFDPKKIPANKWSSGTYIYTPTSLCVIDDEIYFTTRGDRVICLSIDGSYKFYMDGRSNGCTLFEGLQTVVLTNRSIYISDRNGIHQFDRKSNHQHIKTWGTGSCISINSMVFLNDRCYVGEGSHIKVFK